MAPKDPGNLAKLATKYRLIQNNVRQIAYHKSWGLSAADITHLSVFQGR